jgi:hypothetical protein
MRVKTLAAVAILAAGLIPVAVAQDAPAGGPPGQGGGRGMGQMHGVGGQITAINGDTLTLQTFRGETATVKVTPSTQIRKDGADAKLSDFKVGDRIMVAGEQDSKGIWIAQVLGQRSGQRGMGGQRGQGMGMGGQRPAPEDNGKTFIAGTVTKIDGTRLTVKKPDGVEQVIEVDDDTSFRNDRRESVTLADVKVGDFVRGPGALKSNVFVPSQLTAGANRPRQAPPAGSQPGVPPDASQSPAAPDSSNDRK